MKTSPMNEGKKPENQQANRDNDVFFNNFCVLSTKLLIY